MKNKLLTAIFAIFTVLLIISASIALPIYIRPFYYAHIEPYNLTEETGKTEEEIRAAYDEVLDYLTLPNREFGTGVFKHSEEGKSHFVDCKGLFTLDTVVLIVSFVAVTALSLLAARRAFKLSRPFGAHVLLTCGGATLTLFAALGIVIAIDFDTAFTVFHKLFFPGKDNWLFNYSTDEIIRALPQQFFANCALLIGTSIIALSLGCVIFGIVECRKHNRDTKSLDSENLTTNLNSVKNPSRFSLK